ncbi:hypothetical protein D3C80_1957640 [compost metagenome]
MISCEDECSVIVSKKLMDRSSDIPYALIHINNIIKVAFGSRTISVTTRIYTQQVQKYYDSIIMLLQSLLDCVIIRKHIVQLIKHPLV